jgi:transposase
VHANARLTPQGRMTLVSRIAAGRPVAHVAAEMGVSRKTAGTWWHRYQLEGTSGLLDRSSQPRRSPTKVPARTERRIIRLRQRRKLGPARIASILGLATSTVHRVLTRHGLNRLAWMHAPAAR